MSDTFGQCQDAPIVKTHARPKVLSLPDMEAPHEILKNINPEHEKLAPEVGLEPTTHRLTADCSTIELLWIPNFFRSRAPKVCSGTQNGRAIYKPVTFPSNSFLQITPVSFAANFFIYVPRCVCLAFRLDDRVSAVSHAEEFVVNACERGSVSRSRPFCAGS